MEQDPTTISSSPLASFSNFLVHLSPNSLDTLAEHYNDRIEFQDPINQGQGLDYLKLVFADFFKQLQEPSFELLASSGNEESGFVKWILNYKFRGKARQLPGVTFVAFDQSGKVIQHEDFWDASHGVYGEFPLLGLSLRSIQKVLRVKA